MIRIQGLNISYGNLLVVDNVDLQFENGISCLIGQSGCGKTSILNALMHQIEFDVNKYYLGEKDLKIEDASFFRNHFSYLTQRNNFITDLSCYENIRLFASLGGISVSDEEIQNYLNQVGLNNVTKKTYPDVLSGGEKQRLAIAQALVKQSQVILCDEITASLDQETKIEIFELLKKVSREENKIIIMTSHDEDIYMQCDCIYRIENKKIILEKNITYKQQKMYCNEKTKSNIPLKIINKYVLSKIDRQKFYSILYSIITALVVSLCAFLTFFTYTNLSDQQRILKRLSQNQIYVINQTESAIGNNSYSYYTTNHAFEDGVYEKISDIDGVTSVYPYYWISLIEPQTKGVQEIEVSLSYENKEDKIINSTGTPFEYSLIPYYDEQEFQKKMTIINPENQSFGAYVNHIFLMMNGLSEDDLIGATLKATVYPPVGCIEEKTTIFIHDTNESFENINHTNVGTPIEIEIPILGYVDFWYNEDWAQSFIYCPINYMETLREEVQQNYVLQDNEFTWKPNAYMAFVSELEKMEDVNISIRNIDEKIATGNKYMDNTALYQQKRYVEVTAIVAIAIILIAGGILSYVYGIYHYQKQENDIEYFKRNQFTKKEFYKLVTIDSCYEIMIHICFSIPLIILISYFGQIYLNMMRFGMFSKEALIILVLIIIFSIIQALVSKIYYLRKVSDH